MPTILIHMLNEDPVLGEVDELPTKSDTLMLVRSPRRKDGKDLPYIETSVSSVIYPTNRISFIEILPGSEEEIISFVRE
jgi:hypothetical protein